MIWTSSTSMFSSHHRIRRGNGTHPHPDVSPHRQSVAAASAIPGFSGPVMRDGSNPRTRRFTETVLIAAQHGKMNKIIMSCQRSLLTRTRARTVIGRAYCGHLPTVPFTYHYFLPARSIPYSTHTLSMRRMVSSAHHTYPVIPVCRGLHDAIVTGRG